MATRYEDTATWVVNKAIYRTIEQQMVGTGAVKAIEMTNGRELFDMPVVRASSMLSATTSGNHRRAGRLLPVHRVRPHRGERRVHRQRGRRSRCPPGSAVWSPTSGLGGDISDVDALLLKCWVAQRLTV